MAKDTSLSDATVRTGWYLNADRPALEAQSIHVETFPPESADPRRHGLDIDGILWQLPIRAEARGPGLPWDVDLVIDVEPYNGRLRAHVVELTVRCREDDRPITSKTLRAPLRVQQIAREALAAAAASHNPDAVEREAGRLIRGSVPGARRGRLPEIRDDELPDVLRVFEKHGGWSRGKPGGVAAVASQWNVERGTARRAVLRAQKQKAEEEL